MNKVEVLRRNYERLLGCRDSTLNVNTKYSCIVFIIMYRSVELEDGWKKGIILK